MLDLIYEKIGLALLAQEAVDYLNELNLPAIKTVDLFNGQYLEEREEIAYQLPAVFIEFAFANYEGKGSNIEDVQDSIRIHVEQKNYLSSRINGATFGKAMQSLKLLQAVHVICAEINDPDFGRLYRSGRAIDKSFEGSSIDIWEYRLDYLDESTNKYRDFTSSDPDNLDLSTTKHVIENTPVSGHVETPFQIP